MSLVPFVTDYLGKNYRQPMAVALYGLNLALCASAFYLLRIILLEQDRHDLALSDYHGRIQRKNALSGSLYLMSAPLAYVSIYASFFIFALIPAMYFLPEKKLAGRER
jgi:uncharacterized membrane protein